MNDKLNIALGMERMLALGYFAGEFDNFIPVQRGADSERLLKRLRSAAWDLLLLRLPTNLLITNNVEEEVILGYICTSDRALKQIAQACKVEAVMGISPTYIPTPMISYDLSSLEVKVGRARVNDIMKRDTLWQQSRPSVLSEVSRPISFENLHSLISELEIEVAEFCNS